MGVLFPVGSESHARTSANEYEYHRCYNYTGKGLIGDGYLVVGNSAGVERNIAVGNFIRNRKWKDAFLFASLFEQLLHGPHSAFVGYSTTERARISVEYGPS